MNKMNKMSKRELELGRNIFGQEEFDFFLSIGVGKSLYLEINNKISALQESCLNNSDKHDLSYEEQKQIGGFIAHAYICYILPSNKINLIIKNRKLMREYFNQEMDKCYMSI